MLSLLSFSLAHANNDRLICKEEWDSPLGHIAQVVKLEKDESGYTAIYDYWPEVMWVLEGIDPSHDNSQAARLEMSFSDCDFSKTNLRVVSCIKLNTAVFFDRLGNEMRRFDMHRPNSGYFITEYDTSETTDGSSNWIKASFFLVVGDKKSAKDIEFRRDICSAH